MRDCVTSSFLHAKDWELCPPLGGVLTSKFLFLIFLLTSAFAVQQIIMCPLSLRRKSAIHNVLVASFPIERQMRPRWRLVQSESNIRQRHYFHVPVIAIMAKKFIKLLMLFKSQCYMFIYVIRSQEMDVRSFIFGYQNKYFSKFYKCSLYRGCTVWKSVKNMLTRKCFSVKSFNDF